MAGKFSFDDDPVGNNGATLNGNDNGTPGSGTGESGTGTSNHGTAGTGEGTTGETSQFTADAPYGYKQDGTPYKRRPGGGRKFGSTNSGTSANKRGKERVVVNDRELVKQNIGGIHMMAAVVLKQNILILKETEAKQMSERLCDVADYHGIDLMAGGGAIGLYISLATCAYAIYVPRLIAIKMGMGNGPVMQEETKQEWPMGASDRSDKAKAEAGTMNYSEAPLKFN